MSRWLFVSAAFGSLIVAAVACSSSSTTSAGPVDAGGAAEAGDDDAGGGDAGPVGYPAPHTPMPQAVTHKGPVMNAPKLITITFQNDPLQADIEKFGNELANDKAYWMGAVGEYGVGPLTAPMPVHLSETAPLNIDDADVQSWLASKIAGDGGAFPQPDDNTIYALYYPMDSVVTGGGAELCKGFQGYHSNFTIQGTQTRVSYSIIGRCPPPVSGLAEMDEVSAEAVHEFIESATDPFPNGSPAYLDVDANGKAWALLGGGAEIGDLCAAFPDAFYNTTGITNLIQRVWSNQAAAAGHAPCQPEGTSPYFNSAPAWPDDVTFTSNGSLVKSRGVSLPIGSSKTIELDLYSDAPTSGPWKVSALDLTSAFFGGAPALSFTFDKTTGQNGDKINLTIKALSKSPNGPALFWIQNDLAKKQTYWIGVVTN